MGTGQGQEQGQGQGQEQGGLAERSAGAALHCSAWSAHEGAQRSSHSGSDAGTPLCPSRHEERSRSEMTGDSSRGEPPVHPAAGVHLGVCPQLAASPPGERRRVRWQGSGEEGGSAWEHGGSGGVRSEGGAETGERRGREQRRGHPVGVPTGSSRGAPTAWLASSGVALSLALVVFCGLGPFHGLRHPFAPTLASDGNGPLLGTPGARRSLGEVAVEAAPGLEREVFPGLARQDSEWGPLGHGRRRRSLRSSQRRGRGKARKVARKGITVTVGGDKGWTLQAYSPLHLLAGDSLLFAYNETEEAGAGAHDVWRLADEAAFEGCRFTGGTFLGTNDVVVKMRMPGTFYFASSTNSEGNCQAGQKVAVVVTKGRWLPRGAAKKALKTEESPLFLGSALPSLDSKPSTDPSLGRTLDPGVPLVGQALGRAAAASVAWCGAGVPWDSSSAYAAFDMYGCTRVSGIHVQQMMDKSVVVIDRTDAVNTLLKLPNGNNAFGEEIRFTSNDTTNPGVEVPLNVVTNLFCSAGQLLSDGSLLSVGGSTDSSAFDPIYNGSYSIRAYSSPCLQASCAFSLLGNMTDRRWYPTTQVMPDGRVLIVGGTNTTGNVAINKPGINNPTVEYWPRRPNEGSYYLQFLDDTMPYNLYPFLHLLPSGLVFMFAGDSYILFNSATNAPQAGSTPPLQVVHDIDPAPVKRSYPCAGTSAMLPLDPKNGYKAEIMICGGTSTKAVPVNGGSRVASEANMVYQADYFCWRITPEAANPQWVADPMCDNNCTVKYRRVMGDAVLLADGSMLVLNGAQRGFQGLTNRGGFARDPQLQPLLYLSSNHTWYPTSRLPASKVPRLYHSSAVLMPDASVLVTGSNPNTGLITRNTAAPTEFRMERMRPPYLMTALAQPTIIKAPKAISVGSTVLFYFSASQAVTSGDLLTRFKVTLVYPGFSTHNQRHGMRNVNMNLKTITRVLGTKYIASVQAPASLNLAPPTMYWLYVLDNGIPNIEAAAVNFTKKGG